MALRADFDERRVAIGLVRSSAGRRPMRSCAPAGAARFRLGESDGASPFGSHGHTIGLARERSASCRHATLLA
jgi:hypothetical protein